MLTTFAFLFFIVNNNFIGSIPSEFGNLANLLSFIMSKFNNKRMYCNEETFTKQHETLIYFSLAILCEANIHNAGSIPSEMGKLHKCKILILRKFWCWICKFVIITFTEIPYYFMCIYQKTITLWRTQYLLSSVILVLLKHCG